VDALLRLIRENVTKRHLVSGLGILASVGAGVYLTRKQVNEMEAEKETKDHQDALEVIASIWCSNLQFAYHFSSSRLPRSLIKIIY
jgi:hypothetical protein